MNDQQLGVVPFHFGEGKDYTPRASELGVAENKHLDYKVRSNREFDQIERFDDRIKELIGAYAEEKGLGGGFYGSESDSLEEEYNSEKPDQVAVMQKGQT